MTETICAKCNSETESQWRIRLEAESAADEGRTTYRLCRACWNDLRARFSESGSGQ